MTPQELTLQDTRRPSLGYRSLLVAGLVGLTSIACGEDLEITNTPATVVAAGNISGPVEGCPRINPSDQPASDAGDTGVDADTSVDAGAGADADADAGTGADADADAGTGADADAGTDSGVDAGDLQPSSSGAMIARVDDAAAIPYLLKDPEGDDQSVKVEICQWDGQDASQCGVAVQALGGDGSNFVPTTPAGACILHVFHWDVGCGRFVGTDNGGSPSRATIESVDQPLVARVSIVDADETPSQTEPFSLEEIGFESLPECE